MRALATTIIALSTPALAQVCTGSAYPHGVCHNAGTGQSYLPIVENWAASEHVLRAAASELEAIQLLDPTCFWYLKNYECAVAYPACDEGKQILFPCQSACEQAVKACQVTFTVFNKTSLLPTCSAPPSPLPNPLPTSQCLGSVDPLQGIKVLPNESSHLVFADGIGPVREKKVSTAVIILDCLCE
ncbi:hypothetical protein BDK51DRAFT_52120 [Blyttiomyces helicus]|uniref:FZ domain-containing protein n=1 Tax=Blyttiomyces helicus TaxID=388810 RepID=A0A4P9VYN5_9FUNG|nr:hypothetical protein BDK51DRAFT_52120 [Blyttiomyces helicus]|eukprot:RKO83873.1 hypothetical protein BDK51DRAFT_52120 [Blyttiomyces helicus]